MTTTASGSPTLAAIVASTLAVASKTRAQMTYAAAAAKPRAHKSNNKRSRRKPVVARQTFMQATSSPTTTSRPQEPSVSDAQASSAMETQEPQ